METLSKFGWYLQHKKAYWSLLIGSALILLISSALLLGLDFLPLTLCGQQFDTLWDALSGQERLELFASIKGLSRTSKRSGTRSVAFAL